MTRFWLHNFMTCCAVALSADLASANGNGTIQRVLAHDAITSAATLGTDCALPTGGSTFIISFPTTTALDRFAFINQDGAAEGEFEIAVSNHQLPPSSPNWRKVEGNVNFSHKRQFDVSIVGVEAKYVRLTFNVTKAGRLTALDCRTAPTFTSEEHQIVNRVARTNEAQFATEMKLHDSGLTRLNVASLRSKGHVVYVSSGSLSAARRMIDGNPRTRFSFAPNDPAPTAIFEFADEASLHRVTATYRSSGGALEVYALKQLNKNGSDLSGAKLIQVVDDNGTGEALLDFDPVGARYVALRWRRVHVAQRTQRDGKDFAAPADGLGGRNVSAAEVAGRGAVDLEAMDAETDARAEAYANIDGFSVSEIAAYADVPLSFVEASQAPDLYARNMELPPVNGEGGPDFSNKLGTLADPPRLAEPSP